ncbi:MAG: GNAT family N-acetyltransferase [Myxococcota bacterium]
MFTTTEPDSEVFATVRVGRVEDAAAAARAFSASMPVSVWARMGGRMAQTYLAHFAREDDEILIVAEHPRMGIVGACMATARPDRYKRELFRRNWSRLGVSLLRDAIDDPGVVRTLGARVWEGVRGAAQRRIDRHPSPPPSVEHLTPSMPFPLPAPAFMTVYFVMPEARGHQLAQRMTDCCLAEIRRRGFDWVEGHINVHNHASLTTLRRAGFCAVARRGDDLIFGRQLGGRSTGVRSTGVRSDDPASAAVSTEPPKVSVIQDPAAEPSLPDTWAALLAKTPQGSGFHSWAWVGAHLAEVEQPRIAVIRQGSRPIAIFALQLVGSRLTWLAVRRGNYCGPVFDPEAMPAVVEGFEMLVTILAPRTVDLPALRERSPFFAAIRARALGRLGAPAVVNTIGCPEIDLRPGMDAIGARHKSRQRNTWRRKRKKLAALGALVYEELVDAEAIEAALGRAVELYEARWEGLHVDKPFGREDQPFQRAAARALARDGHVQMSVLRLDGEIIAFAYALRARGISSSYTLAHDERYAPFSPGLLLLLELLGRAAERGDPSFDFSLGDAPYKALWSTGRQEVFRVVWGAGARRRVAVDRAKAVMRRSAWLRRLKQHGVRGAIARPAAPASIEWWVQRLDAVVGTAGGELEVEPMDLAAMRRWLDEARFGLAMARAFRGDRLLMVREAGIPRAAVWAVTGARRAVVTGGQVALGTEEVYVQPIPLGEGLERRWLVQALGPGLLVSEGPVAGRPLARFFADHSFRQGADSPGRGNGSA